MEPTGSPPTTTLTTHNPVEAWPTNNLFSTTTVYKGLLFVRQLLRPESIYLSRRYLSNTHPLYRILLPLLSPLDFVFIRSI